MSNSDELDRMLARLTDYRTEFERALGPNRVLEDLIKATQPATSQWLRGIDLGNFTRAMQPTAHLTATSQMEIAVGGQHRILNEVARLNDLQQITHRHPFFENITAPYKALRNVIRSQAEVLESSCRVAGLESIESSFSRLYQSMQAWDAASIGLTNRLHNIGLLARNEALATRLFEVPGVYVSFVQHTTARLAADPAPTIAARLRGSLNLAEYQLLGITAAAGAFEAFPEDGEEPERIRVLDAPFTQQDELLSGSAEDEDDTEALTAASGTAQTVEQARRVLELVTRCNEAGKTSALGVDIFKPTTRLMTVFLDLPWLSATDRLRFGDVIDCLYFIFYEGAGRDHLRFLEKNGGPLTEEDCELIWCIKHLRNKWSRHDADHGKEGDIKRSWAELAAKLRWLGLAEHPTEVRHFQVLHYKLLELAENFLVRILQKLSLKP